MTTEETKATLLSRGLTTQFILCLVVFALFAPFVDKAFNIDDPLFIWAAKHIQQNPLDFYGFDVNWYKTVQSMASVTKNPPLFSYYLAGVGTLFGWSEIALHLSMMVPLIAFALGTFRLAGKLGAEPVPAVLISICTPVVMVSGTSVMCDMAMVAFWVWALSFWIEGIAAPSRPWLLAVAGLLIAASGLTKYFGASLIPLVAAYSLMRRAPLRLWLPYLLIPVFIFCLYEWVTGRMYGVGLFSDAFVYSSDARSRNYVTPIAGLVEGLSFTGGGLIVVLFLAPFWLRLKDWLKFAGLGIFFTAVFVLLCSSGHQHWSISLQQSVFVMTGCILLAAAVSGYLQHKEADSLLLALWVLGTFIFTAFINWTVSGRNLLPLAPAAGIIISRQIGASVCSAVGKKLFAFALLPALSLALVVATADYRWAGGVRNAVRSVPSSISGKRIWFAGHWGFQYYMELIGGTAVVPGASQARQGDVFVTPSFGADLVKPPMDAMYGIEQSVTNPLPWLALVDPYIGAGFHSTGIGPHPYVFGRVKPDRYWVLGFNRDVQF